MSENTKTVSTPVVHLDSLKTYFLGYSYINGNWSMTDPETKEKRSGHSDKYDLFFASPIDVSKNNQQGFGGHTISRLSVNTSIIPFIFGVQSFDSSVLDSLLYKPVRIDYTVAIGSNGQPTYKLRSIVEDVT